MYRRLSNAISLKQWLQSIKDVLGFSVNNECDEKAFRFLLENEVKRSERSGYSCQVLLVWRVNSDGRIVPLESSFGKIVMASLSQSLRDTDYVGWYRQGLVIGGVLTVVGRNSAAGLFNPYQRKLLQHFEARLGVEEASRLRVLVCHPHELGAAKSGLEDFVKA